MFKRIISLGLCLVMLAVMFAGCGKKAATPTTTTNTDDLPSTINLIGITDKSTTQEAIDRVEEALNKISKTRYKTKIELTLVTADQYIAEVEKRIAEADHAAVKVKAITKFNALAQKQANNAQKLLNESSGKKTNKWTSQVTTVIASTMTTGEIYSAEQTTVYEDGKIETVYPDAQSPIDILMIDGKEMYDYLNDKGYLLSVEKKLDEKFTKFKQYIYPTFFNQLKAMTGDINAIPNNNLMAEYTYLVIDKTIADSYNNGNGFNIDNVEDYADLSDFLAYVKANHKDVAPLATEPEALGVYKYMDGEVAIGAYFDPIYGYDTAEGTDFTVQNLLSIPQYQAHVALMKEFNDKGYINTTATKFAVNVIKGDASVAAAYGDQYDVKVIQNPFVTPDAIFDGMMAVSAYTSSEDRALEVIEMFTTDPDAKNIFQYGILDDGDNTAYANYKLVEVEPDKFVVQRLNQNYKMDNGLTGNVYMGYPEEGQVFNAWDYYKQTNLDSKISPFLLLYVEPSSLDNILTSVLKRAALTAALDSLTDVEVTYDEYVKEAALASSKGIEYIRALRKAYMPYLISELAKTDASYNPLDFVTNANATEAVKEFIAFAESKEGQEIIANAGYYPLAYNPKSYEKKSSLSGEIVMYANTGSNKSYIESAFNGLADAFIAMYPNVTITRPVADGLAGYNDNLMWGKMTNGTNVVCISYATPDMYADNATTVAKSYVSIFDNPTDKAFSQTWFENRIIDKVKAEQYANVISASDLEKMVQNQVAILGGAPNMTEKKEEIPDSQRLVLAAAKDSASNYFTNIKYLRVMADIILFEDLSEAERARYDSMTDVDFEAAIFDYVKANYETENNLTEEGYVTRVQDFMASVLEFVSEEDSTVKYLVSWKEFEAAEEGAKPYEEAATTIVEQYRSRLGYSDALWNTMTLDKKMDAVYDLMYTDYLTENGYDRNDFEESIRNKYLNPVGTNASEFKTYSKTSDEYKNYVKKLRKKNKSILIEKFSATAYKNGEKGISNEKVVEALYEYYLEEALGIYADMADMAGVSKADFKASEKHYTNYARYINTMKTKYVYTLRTKYTQNQINAWGLAEAKTNIYNILYETGFYTNELARYIGLELSEYMLSKSEAVTYQNYLTEIANKLDAEIAAKGYDKATLLKGDGSELEAIAREIVAEKFFGDKVGITDVMKDLSGKYVKDYTDVNEMKANADKLSSDGFFMAVVNELQAMWDERRAELEK
ncbi:MAG: hypothetical protein IJD59_10520 [Clostridia bacterium]|nr:hypothetical protein [Clostridia bacterium]